MGNGCSNTGDKVNCWITGAGTGACRRLNILIISAVELSVAFFASTPTGGIEPAGAILLVSRLTCDGATLLGPVFGLSVTSLTVPSGNVTTSASSINSRSGGNMSPFSPGPFVTAAVAFDVLTLVSFCNSIPCYRKKSICKHTNKSLYKEIPSLPLEKLARYLQTGSNVGESSHTHTAVAVRIHHIAAVAACMSCSLLGMADNCIGPKQHLPAIKRKPPIYYKSTGINEQVSNLPKNILHGICMRYMTTMRNTING